MPTHRVLRGPQAPTANPAFLNHTFRTPELLIRALTHRSLSCESSPKDLPHAIQDTTTDNEQLEFLGDAVLGMVVAEALYRLFPASREGELTRLRASLVSRKSLAEAAVRIRLGDLLRLGRGEERTGGRAKPAILANAFEAVIAALYLDAGLEAPRRFIDRHLIQPALPSLHAALSPGTPPSPEPSATTNPPSRSSSRQPVRASPSTSSPPRPAPTTTRASTSKSA